MKRSDKPSQSRWLGRLDWFIAGVLACAAFLLAREVYTVLMDSSVTISVANSLNVPVRLQLSSGSGQAIDLGTLPPGGEFKREYSIDRIGEGRATLLVDSSTHHEYDLGFFISGKGPVERYVRLTPKGTAGFFYASSKGSWCGMLDEK